MTAQQDIDFVSMSRGRYRAFAALNAQDVDAAQALRAICFGLKAPRDVDALDALQHHILICDERTQKIVCCFRLRIMMGHQLAESYAAQFYGLGGLAGYSGLLMELGRFCVHPEAQDPEVVRTAWAAMTQLVDAHDIKLIFGCSSFAGIDADVYRDTFALLRARHLAPQCWRPTVTAADVVHFSDGFAGTPDLRLALHNMPPLLRTYLLMGGWVSDHAVVDRQFNTLHVLTGLEIAAISEGRKRLLRSLI